MTLTEWFKLGTENAPMVHEAGDVLPEKAALGESVTQWCMDELGRMPTACEMACYAEGWLCRAAEMNDASSKVVCDA